MKYELETIPVWEALKKDEECFLCTLMKQSEQDALSYYLGSSVMHPETRVQVNRIGFCPNHWKMLLQGGSTQSLALITHTYLEQTNAQLNKVFNHLGTIKEGKPIQKALKHIEEIVKEREQGCLVCTDMQKRLLRYVYTAIQLWTTDPDFRRAFESSKGVCLNHLSSLLQMASQTLGPLQLKAFVVALAQVTTVKLKKLEEDIHWMTQKYKAEHIDKSWNGCEDAHRRTISALVGESRVIDPL